MRQTTRHDDSGQTTAEYAVGTVGAAGCAALLAQLATGDWWYDWILALLRLAMQPVLGGFVG